MIGDKGMDPLKMTDKAVEQIKSKIAQNNAAIGLRLTVATTGCSGNSYKMEHVLEEDLTADDKFEQDGAVLYVPKMHSWMLFGTVVDYEEGKLSSGFTFTNPNEAGRCGCGESFTVERPDSSE
jgi:iron-sulfur cluster assembly protein